MPLAMTPAQSSDYSQVAAQVHSREVIRIVSLLRSQFDPTGRDKGRDRLSARLGAVQHRLTGV